jgi:hypothetical protein
MVENKLDLLCARVEVSSWSSYPGNSGQGSVTGSAWKKMRTQRWTKNYEVPCLQCISSSSEYSSDVQTS